MVHCPVVAGSLSRGCGVLLAWTTRADMIADLVKTKSSLPSISWCTVGAEWLAELLATAPIVALELNLVKVHDGPDFKSE